MKFERNVSFVACLSADQRAIEKKDERGFYYFK